MFQKRFLRPPIMLFRSIRHRTIGSGVFQTSLRTSQIIFGSNRQKIINTPTKYFSCSASTRFGLSTAQTAFGCAASIGMLSMSQRSDWTSRKQFRSSRCFGSSSYDIPTSSASVDELLNEAASFADVNEPGEWSSAPYPKNADPRRDQAKKSRRPSVDPKDTSIILFPGQGSQFVKMAQELQEYPNVPEIYESASEILGYDLLKLCMQGPKSELDQTIHCQPAVFVTSIAAIEKLRFNKPKAIENCIATAGFSVGEYTALVFAGCINFEDALKLIKIRAEAMQEACQLEPSGMITVIDKAESQLSKCMTAARKHVSQQGFPRPVLTVANYLFPQCKVLAGHEAALLFVMEHARDFKLGPLKRLPVSGAFHTKLMITACRPLSEALQSTAFHRPRIDVHSNVDSLPHSADPKVIKKMLLRQLTSPVRWEQTMHVIFDRQKDQGYPMTFEAGPGSQLSGMLKRCNARAAAQCESVMV